MIYLDTHCEPALVARSANGMSDVRDREAVPELSSALALYKTQSKIPGSLSFVL